MWKEGVPRGRPASPAIYPVFWRPAATPLTLS
jgi:hypothetical protein